MLYLRVSAYTHTVPYEGVRNVHMYVQVLKEHKAVGEELYQEGSTVTLLICRAILSRYAHIAADRRRRTMQGWLLRGPVRMHECTHYAHTLTQPCTGFVHGHGHEAGYRWPLRENCSQGRRGGSER